MLMRNSYPLPEIFNIKHTSSMGLTKNFNPEPKPKPKNKSQKTSEIEIATRTGKRKRVADTFCPFRLPIEVEGNYIIQFKSLAPEYATTYFGITPKEMLNINDVNSRLEEANRTHAIIIHKSFFNYNLFMPSLNKNTLMPEVIIFLIGNSYTPE